MYTFIKILKLFNHNIFFVKNFNKKLKLKKRISYDSS